MTQTNPKQILDSILPWLSSKVQDTNREIDAGNDLIKENAVMKAEIEKCKHSAYYGRGYRR